MEGPKRIEDDASGDVSGRERFPDAIAELPKSPATCEKDCPACEDINIVWMLASGVESQSCRSTARSDEGKMGIARHGLEQRCCARVL